MVKVYGASDDLVEIEESDFEEDEIVCHGAAARIRFDDDTVIRVEYGKDVLAIWAVTVEVTGTAQMALHVCKDEDDEPYSDVFSIDAEIEDVEIVEAQGYDPGWLRGWTHA